MKVLLLGEYSNVHNTLAQGLRALGHEVCVASNGDFWKDYPRDIDLKHEFGLRGQASFFWRLMKALPKMRGYDVVQLINPIFVELKAERIAPIYRYLRRHNRKVVMCAFGMDYYWASVNSTIMPMRYSDFNFGKEVRHDAVTDEFRNDWVGTPKQTLNDMIAHDCDAIVSGLYEYWMTYNQIDTLRPKNHFIPYPIAMSDAIADSPKEAPSLQGGRGESLSIFLGISRQRNIYKGTDIMLRAVEALKQKYPDRIDLQIANGVPFNVYQDMIDNADILIDQLYGYTPAMNALLAMSKGIVVCGGGEPENYDILNETELRPIINVQPTYQSCYDELEHIILNPQLIPVMKQQSVEYIRRHHDHLKVAQQYVKLYNSL